MGVMLDICTDPERRQDSSHINGFRARQAEHEKLKEEAAKAFSASGSDGKMAMMMKHTVAVAAVVVVVVVTMRILMTVSCDAYTGLHALSFLDHGGALASNLSRLLHKVS